MDHCPCCSGKSFQDCCDMFISGKQLPHTPEQLMRSRYTAYTLANIDYIIKTMKPPALDQLGDAQEARDWSQQQTWVKLEVKNSRIENPDKGFVEFLAHYAHHDKRYVIHEISEFHRIDGQWFYVDGIAGT